MAAVTSSCCSAFKDEFYGLISRLACANGFGQFASTLREIVHRSTCFATGFDGCGSHGLAVFKRHNPCDQDRSHEGRNQWFSHDVYELAAHRSKLFDSRTPTTLLDSLVGFLVMDMYSLRHCPEDCVARKSDLPRCSSGLIETKES